MTLERLDQLEDRIQKPAYLLFLVVVLLFLIIGLVDVIDHVSKDPVLFGRYSLKYFGVVVGSALIVLAWAALLFRPNDDRLLKASLGIVQQRPILAVAILIGIALLLAFMLSPQNRIHGLFLEFPALQATVLLILFLTAGFILFYQVEERVGPQLWRTGAISVIAVVLVVELIMQALAYFGALPNLTGPLDSFAPYSRVYQNAEGFGNGIANNYGRYVPDFQLLPGSKRIAIVGDSFIQALQINSDQNLGVVLQQRLKDDGMTTEILTLGYPDLGPGMYLSNWKLEVVASELEAEEVIIFFDLGSDFQTVDRAGTGVPFYTYAGQGRVNLKLDNFWDDLHKYEHEVYHGHEGFQLVRLLHSHYLTPRVLLNFINQPTAQAAEPAPTPNSDVDLPNGFVFNAEINDGAMLVAKGLIYMAQEQLKRSDVGVKLVTIPVFTDAFYAQEAWNTQFGVSDLLLPERELRKFAEVNGIPFLGLGAYMAAENLAPADVQTLYFANGRGHFTPAGHAFTAQAVYECFFTMTATPAAGCDPR